ncbi:MULTISPECIES: hypothetical protein [unclassified Caballeronia]|jgi:hypothetical protein|uniref:hypothetical protein n=1 Tax=unclassified Caballeronia TaxID=2646786 RepID=UPI002027D8DB|nr:MULTISPECIES: hypothetical protein [unclassified Caballeronia]
MAGDWIKMRSNLWDDPRVARLCDLTDANEATVIGGLYWLWSTADQHSEDGCMPGLTPRSIDRKTGIPGFAAALIEIDWLEDDPQGVVLKRFEEHNGASAKKRAVTAKRVSAHRGNADVTQAALQEEQGSVTGALAREREEEEKNKTIGSNSASGESEGIAQANSGTRAVDLSVAMRSCGIQSNPSDPRLQALAEQGVTAETVRAAAEEAKRTKPNERISPAYVVAIVQRWADDAARISAAGAQAPMRAPAAGQNRQEALEARNRSIALELAQEAAAHATH